MKTPTEPLRGEKLLKTAVNQILKNPETWNQGSWHSSCGTKHCIAGWCQILSGTPANGDTAAADAREALRISHWESDHLFRGDCSLTEIYEFAKNFTRDGYDRAGYDRAGYDRDGYTRAGYDRAGYDRDGYTRAGYNRDGYTRAGYTRAGYNRAGKKLPLFEV